MLELVHVYGIGSSLDLYSAFQSIRLIVHYNG